MYFPSISFSTLYISACTAQSSPIRRTRHTSLHLTVCQGRGETLTCSLKLANPYPLLFFDFLSLTIWHIRGRAAPQLRGRRGMGAHTGRASRASGAEPRCGK